jgi:molybdate transport system substrate-binding protein
MVRKSIVSVLLILGTILASTALCCAGPGDREILVSAAISLKNAFDEIGSLYEKQTGVKARFNLGASGLLQKQIESGAPVDVFASAAEKQMDALQSQGLILTDTRRIFARNTLVLVVAPQSKPPVHSFSDLMRQDVARIAIGNPKTVPAGLYAQEALTNLKVWDKIRPRLVLAENVRQVLDYVVRGEADAGLVYASDVASVHGEVRVAANAPENSHSPILYSIALVKDTKARTNARQFINLALSAEGQAVLKKYGFLGSR